MRRLALSASVLTGCAAMKEEAVNPPTFPIVSPALTVTLTKEGELAGAAFQQNRPAWAVKGRTMLAGCRMEGSVASKKLPGSGYSFTRTFADGQKHRCTVTDRFTPTKDSIRWEVEIVGDGAPWSTTIETHLQANGGDMSFWAPWGDPRLSAMDAAKDEAQIANAVVPPGVGGNWGDPLIPRPLANCTLWYGAPYFRYDDPRIAFCPFQGDLLCIPMVSLLRTRDDTGLSLVLSPQDPILDLTLTMTADGGLAFNRFFLRISDKSPIRFAADLVPHEADWRGSLRWMTRRYPEYFDPVVPAAADLAGTGAYSSNEAAFDAAKMKRMSFRTNWKASFDFPYMGLFLPPVDDDKTPWERYGGGTTTIAAMRDYAQRMRADGFHVLSYFNVTEFGASVQYPAPKLLAASDKDFWKDCNQYLYSTFSNAILRVPDRIKPDKLSFYAGTGIGGPYFTWGDGIIMDCGEPVYQAFLLDQARRHIEQIPDADGICIDRMDWLRMYNEQRDDGVSWCEGRPARSLLTSWRDLLDKLGPMMHKVGKVVFVNNHDKRIDLLRHVDGIFDEFTYGGAPLNTTALLCIRKPALGWTANEDNLSPDPDKFFQKYLYLGVYPMAPFPANDHSLAPSPTVDQHYLDYGPLMDAMRGKKWVLEPHCIEAATPGVKVNLFEVPGGYVAPVTFGCSATTVTVRVRNIPGVDKLKAEALHPGAAKAHPVPARIKDGALELNVPLARGCAMLRLIAASSN